MDSGFVLYFDMALIEDTRGELSSVGCENNIPFKLTINIEIMQHNVICVQYLSYYRCSFPQCMVT